MDALTEMVGHMGPAQLVFLAGLGLMSMILLVRSRRHFRHATVRSSAPPAAIQNPSGPSGGRQSGAARAAGLASDPRRDFEQFEVAMHELARDLMGQLDSKIRVLELLIREADVAAERLGQARGNVDRGAVTSGAAHGGAIGSAPDRLAANQASTVGQGGKREIAKLASAGGDSDLHGAARGKGAGSLQSKSLAPPRPKLVVDQSPASATPAHGEFDSPPRSEREFQIAGNPRFERVFALADAGMSATTIAKQIGSQIGEIELILSLRGAHSEQAG